MFGGLIQFCKQESTKGAQRSTGLTPYDFWGSVLVFLYLLEIGI